MHQRIKNEEDREIEASQSNSIGQFESQITGMIGEHQPRFIDNIMQSIKQYQNLTKIALFIAVSLTVILGGWLIGQKNRNDQISYLSQGPQVSQDQIFLATQMMKEDTINIYDYERDIYEEKYQISKYQQKPFCIAIPTYNNVADDRFKKNIDSVLLQHYNNFRVMIIDDASPDSTGSALQEYLQSNSVYKQMLGTKIKLQINKQNRGALTNTLQVARNFCNSNDIFMVLDGDDYLIGQYVFKLFNSFYSSQDVWIVYSNYVKRDFRVGYSRQYFQEVLDQGMFRQIGFYIGHLRSCYASLVQKVKDQDLRDQDGNYYKLNSDLLILLPVMEMAGPRQVYIKQVCYYYNSDTGLNDWAIKSEQQKNVDKKIRAMPRYQPLDHLF